MSTWALVAILIAVWAALMWFALGLVGDLERDDDEGVHQAEDELAEAEPSGNVYVLRHYRKRKAS